MEKDLKMGEMTQRGRRTALVFDPEDWASLGLAFLALGALVVAVIASKTAPGRATTVATR